MDAAGFWPQGARSCPTSSCASSPPLLSLLGFLAGSGLGRFDDCNPRSDESVAVAIAANGMIIGKRGGAGLCWTKTWRSRVAEKIHELEWERVALDVRTFLEDVQEIELVTRENVLALL